MFVDIHTHNPASATEPAIRNLSFTEAEIILLSNEKGLYSVGFHPWLADEYSVESFSRLKNWATDKRIIALGECGLDKFSKVSLVDQVSVLVKQIELSEKLQKPLIIHCVGCFNQLLELKRIWNTKQRWIIHGFRGKPELAAQVLKAGCFLSFGERFNPESVLITPIDKLFVETDESLLTISDIYRAISKVKGCRDEELIAGESFFGGYKSTD